MMKTSKFFCLAFALLCFSQLAVAQVKVSPKVGLNVSGVDAKLTDFDAEARAGWNAGMDLRVGKGLLFLAPGVHYYNYTARLMENLDENSRIDFTEETTIQSINVPLNIGLRVTGDNGLLGLHVRGGVVPTYVMSVKAVDNFNFSVDQLQRITWGANVGAGLDLLFFTADVTYERGLTDFFADAEGKNNVLTFSLGLKF